MFQIRTKDFLFTIASLSYVQFLKLYKSFFSLCLFLRPLAKVSITMKAYELLKKVLY
jgi:hypothetical protein